MQNKRLLTIAILVLFGMLGLGANSIAALRAPVQPLAGCGSGCGGNISCYNPKCPCNEYPPDSGNYICQTLK